MKKVLCALLCAPLMLSGCAGASYNDEFISVNTLPYEMEVDDGVSISLSDVNFYYLADSSGYEYYPIAVVAFDRSKVDDRAMHFLQKDDTDMVNCMIDSDSNNIDGNFLPEVYEQVTDTELKYYFMDSQKYRENFEDIRGTVFVKPINDDSAEKHVQYMASFNGQTNELKAYVNHYEQMPEEEKIALSTGINGGSPAKKAQKAYTQASTETPTPTATPTPDPLAGATTSQRQALSKAKSYLNLSGFSYQGLIDQLSSQYGEGFSVEDATFAADHCEADWNAEALEKAKSYLSMSGFSYQGIIDQLSSNAGDKFTVEQATYAADNCGADWNQEAVEAGQSYLQLGGFSRSRLIEQLSSNSGSKFTKEQATYAADQLGL